MVMSLGYNLSIRTQVVARELLDVNYNTQLCTLLKQAKVRCMKNSFTRQMFPTTRMGVAKRYFEQRLFTCRHPMSVENVILTILRMQDRQLADIYTLLAWCAENPRAILKSHVRVLGARTEGRFVGDACAHYCPQLRTQRGNKRLIEMVPFDESLGTAVIIPVITLPVD